MKLVERLGALLLGALLPVANISVAAQTRLTLEDGGSAHGILLQRHRHGLIACRRCSGGRPRISPSMAQNSAIRLKASPASGEACAICTS